MYVYGSGDVFLTQGSGTHPDSVQIGTLQEVSIDIDPGELKKHYGQKTYPVAVARGKGGITGKAKSGAVQPEVLSMVLGGAKTAGTVEAVVGESATIPADPFQVTVAGSATYKDDRGVLDLTSGLYMLRVASAPTTGQYSVNTSTGVYTFAAADTGHSVRISYRKTVAGSGSTVKVTNANMGVATTYVVDLYNTSQDGKKFGLLLYAAALGKFAAAFKNEEFTMPDIDIEGIADANDNVYEFYFPV